MTPKQQAQFKTKTPPPATTTTTTTTSGAKSQPKQESASPPSCSHHKLDKYGFIINMNSRGQVVPPNDMNHNVDDDDDDEDEDDDDNEKVFHRKSYHYSHNAADRPPTFAEHLKSKRRERKWNKMMGRWHVPDPVTLTKTAAKEIQKGTKQAAKELKKGVGVVISPLQIRSSIDADADGDDDDGHETTLDLAAQFHNVPPGKRAFHHRRKVITRLRKGVPDHIRGQVWQYLARVPHRMKQHPGLYRQLVLKSIRQHEEASQQQHPQQQQQQQQQQTELKERPPLNPAYSSYMAQHAKSFKNIQDTIERDIHRTYPRHHLFYESDGDDDLDNSTVVNINEDDEHGDDEYSSLDYARGPNGGPQDISAGSNNNNNNHDHDTPRTASEHKEDHHQPLPSPTAANSEKPQKRTTSILSKRNPSPKKSASAGGGGPNEIGPNRRAISLSSSSPKSLSSSASPVSSAAVGALKVTSMEHESSSAPPANFCGNEEITNMIRELEGVVGASDRRLTTAKNNNNASADYAQRLVRPLPSLLDDSEPGALHTTTAFDAHGARKPPAQVANAVGGQASLRRVLKAYSVYDREVGYCQGMNFVAGLFLTLMPEEESFWLLVYVMNDAPCRMRGLFGEGMRETHMVLFVAERLIQHYLPRIHAQLEREHVHITMFATQWLLTQFTSNFKFDLVTRVWDAFLGEGWKMTYRVMLAILKLYEAQIISATFEDVLTLFRELPDQIKGATVMDLALQIPLQTKFIQKYENEFLLSQPLGSGGSLVGASSSNVSRPSQNKRNSGR